MRLLLFVLLLTFQYGCQPNQGLSSSAAADINISNISRLQRGMTQEQVVCIMNQPYDDQVFVLDDATYDLWFYVTNGTVLGQSRMLPGNLTPLAFKNGILIGWGKGYANYLNARKTEIEKAKLTPPALPTPEEKVLENKPIENLLAPQSATPDPNKKPANPKGAPKRAEPPLNLSPLEPQTPPPAQKDSGAAPKKSDPKKGTAPNSSSPDWSPLEQQPIPPDQPPPPAGGSTQTTMSKPPEKKEKEPDPKSVPLSEEDEEMLRDERQQDFDQT